ncbi:MAG: 4Fe-4S cluster-binding domain-containing protein, partial [Acidobacteriota bacterium]|nr:4Fe-4S cluster-binding domain-containing protein [Acidobacteriota bacterium]
MLDIDIEKKLQAIDKALKDLSPQEEECHICPRECGVNRRKGEKGFSQTGVQAIISHAGLHFGEEPILSGHSDLLKRKGFMHTASLAGSGTIFFAGCNLKCLYCQNYQISWQQLGQSMSSEKLASAMLKLQAQGALNINLVSPTHMILPILKALKTAYGQGLKLPVVYNSSGYEKAEIIKYFD